ncbi:MAG: LON peptidase substrate-binding domain-containing protein [Planctomycetes bacterium]|nr:LON peptidase substrate-binding domain-containing protein [Planctomycetota bacterium]
MELDFDPSAFSGNVPLFPLPGAVILPAGLLPLHVFEDRYRDMLGDALAGERLVALAHLLPGYEEHYEGNPEIDPYVCVGRIIMDQQLPDGRYNMVLAGVRRARVVEEDQSRTYRVGRVEILEDHCPEAFDEAETARRLHHFLEQLPQSFVRHGDRLGRAMLLLDQVPTAPLGLVVDLLADTLELSLPTRLALLREDRVPSRVATLTDRLRERARTSGRAPRPLWPPRFSAN